MFRDSRQNDQSVNTSHQPRPRIHLQPSLVLTLILHPGTVGAWEVLLPTSHIWLITHDIIIVLEHWLWLFRLDNLLPGF